MRKIILIPFEKYTRSSLVTGIFAAHGCWTGETKKLRYDTYENLRLFWWMLGAMHNDIPPSPDAMKLRLDQTLPDKGFIVLKAYHEWHDLWKDALEDDIVGEFYPSRLRCATRCSVKELKKKGVTPINTDTLIKHDFRQMSAAIRSCGLEWDEETAESVFDPTCRRRG